MRSATAPELAVLAATARREALRVKVENGSGTMIDLTSWVLAVTWDEDIDQPVAGCTIHFRRDSGTTQSLAPFREDSTLNRLDDGVTYAPQIQMNRSITIEAATTAIGAAIVAGDYKLQFEGTIHDFDVAQSSVPVVCRDLGGLLVDRWIETEQNYGSLIGDDLEDVMQAELDDVLGPGTMTLFVEDLTGYVVSPPFRQQRQSLSDALLALQQLPGFDVRYRWDDGTSSFRLTLREPDRGKVVPDYTFGPSDYYVIPRLELDETDIRNAIEIEYPLGDGTRATEIVTDASSISEFGRQYLFLQEADTSPINTSAEAIELITAALADLKDPKAEQEIELPFFPLVQLGDLYRFSANGKHYSTDQDWAVVSYRHEFIGGDPPRFRTYLTVRGSPAGGYLTWLRRARGPGGGVSSRAPIATVEPLDTEPDNLSMDLRFDAIPGSGGGGTIIAWEIYTKVSDNPEVLFTSGDGSVLPLDTTILRASGHEKMVRYVVTDTATGLSDVLLFAIPASESTPATLDDLPDGVTYVRTTSNEKDGAARAFQAIDAFGKLFGTTATPSISVPTGAGAMGTGPTGTIIGTDTAGRIHTVVGTSPAATGEICTITFATAYPTAPFVVVVAANQGGMNAQAYSTNVTTGAFTVRTDSGYGGAGANLDFYYMIIG